MDLNTNFSEATAAHSILALAKELEEVCYYQDCDLPPATRALFTKCYRSLRLICIEAGLGDHLFWNPQPGAKFQRKVKPCPSL